MFTHVIKCKVGKLKLKPCRRPCVGRGRTVSLLWSPSYSSLNSWPCGRWGKWVSKGTRSQKFITLSVHLCLQHVYRGAARHAGSSAWADTCYVSGQVDGKICALCNDVLLILPVLQSLEAMLLISRWLYCTHTGPVRAAWRNVALIHHSQHGSAELL